MSPNDDPRHSGYPLAALFVLIAVCATLLAMWAAAVRAVAIGQVGIEVMIASAVVTSILGGVVGCGVGLYHHRRAMGGVLGGANGLILGVLIGPLIGIPLDGFPSLIVASLVGSAVLVVIGVVSRLTADRPQSPP
jgi:hypothetical protein